MPVADLRSTPGSVFAENSSWVAAAVALVVAFAAAWIVNRAFERRGQLLRGDLALSREADTRLRFVQRLVTAVIALLGVATAASQFTGINRLATSVLASGAIAAAIVGFAARQTLANVVAGIMLAITQPIRVGDWVTFGDAYGEVEDVRLNYTVLRTPGDQRIVIPNEQLAGGVLRNDTLGRDLVAPDVAVWVPPESDADRAVRVLHEETGQDVTVAEAQPWGTRLEVGAEPVAPPERGAREAELRALCLRRLRAEGLLRGGGEASGPRRRNTGPSLD